jgi:hypothetical protein
MIIKEGSYYKRRNGEIVGPATVHYPIGVSKYSFKVGEWLYSKTGSFESEPGTRTYPQDLVEEVIMEKEEEEKKTYLPWQIWNGVGAPPKGPLQVQLAVDSRVTAERAGYVADSSIIRWTWENNGLVSDIVAFRLQKLPVKGNLTLNAYIPYNNDYDYFLTVSTIDRKVVEGTFKDDFGNTLVLQAKPYPGCLE